MSINKIEIQDGSGNVYYPKTSIDSVIYSDNTSIGEKIIMLERKLIELKSQLADSINNKTGSSLTSNSTVDEMAVAINSIKTLEQATADANATASNILVDKTAYVNGTKVTGTMPNKGAVTQTLSANGTVNLGSGHYDSIKITQSLNTRSATTWKPSTSTQSIPSGTYLAGTQTIQGDSNLIASNIKKGVSIFGVNGEYTFGTNNLVKSGTVTVAGGGQPGALTLNRFYLIETTRQSNGIKYTSIVYTKSGVNDTVQMFEKKDNTNNVDVLYYMDGSSSGCYTNSIGVYYYWYQNSLVINRGKVSSMDGQKFDYKIYDVTDTNMWSLLGFV